VVATAKPDHEKGAALTAALPASPASDAGTPGGAKSPGPASAPPVTSVTGGVPDPPPDTKKAKKAYSGPPVDCEWCGKRCKNPGGLGSHKRHCKKRPDAGKVKPAPPMPPPRKLDEWTAAEGAEKAEALIDSVTGADGGVVEVIARMDAAEVGVPDLIALVCLRALPPPLSNEEYAALRMAWKDNKVAIPPWLMTVLVTLAVLGPRAASHPVAGPWLRKQLLGTAGDESAPEPEPIVPPAPRPAPAPEPTPPPKAAAAATKIREAMEAA
jgi:hypothetical protein